MAEYTYQTVEETAVVNPLHRSARSLLYELSAKVEARLGFWRAYGWEVLPVKVEVITDPVRVETTIKVSRELRLRRPEPTDG